MHDNDREKATSLVKNLILPGKKYLKNNPLFNKTLEKEPELNLLATEL
jgi:hypothetical protein